MNPNAYDFLAQKLRTQFQFEPDSLADMQNELMRAEYAPNSIEAMDGALKNFARYCAAFGRESFPATPETMREFITWAVRIRRHRLGTIALGLWAVDRQHKQAGIASPVDATVKTLWHNCRRALKEPRRNKRALTVEQLRRLLNRLHSGDAMDLRDRAIIGMGFASALRRSELAALVASDITINGKGLLILVRTSKTDQTGDGVFVAIPYGEDPHTCPVRVMKEWLALRGDWEGPVFTRFTFGRQPRPTREPIGGQTIARILKRSLELIGVESSPYGAHSLRAGMATAAAENGASVIAIQMRTRHRRVESVLRYIRPAQAFQGDPLAGVL